MLNIAKKNYLVIGLIAAVISFILLFVGVGVVLGNEFTTGNIVAFTGFSILVGSLVALMIFFTYKIVFFTFIAGLVIGFFEMYRAFMSGMSGWGDLIGLLSLFIWTVSGLGSGICAEVGYHFYKRSNK